MEKSTLNHIIQFQIHKTKYQSLMIKYPNHDKVNYNEINPKNQNQDPHG